MIAIDAPVVAIVCAYDLAWDCSSALRVVACESGGDPGAVSPDGRYRGLFQVEGGSLDPAENTAQAYAMWLQRGWQPWPVCARGLW